MPVYTVWMLQEASIAIPPPAPGVQPGLDGVTQGDGSHLLNRQITLINGNFLRTFIEDTHSDFEDNDTSQTLAGQQTIEGVTYLHLLFDRHEIILAEGAEVESLLPDRLTRADLAPAQRAELEDLLPGMTEMDPAAHPGAARGCLTVREGRLPV
jgi:hypothetical protein